MQDTILFLVLLILLIQEIKKISNIQGKVVQKLYPWKHHFKWRYKTMSYINIKIILLFLKIVKYILTFFINIINNWFWLKNQNIYQYQKSLENISSLKINSKLFDLTSYNWFLDFSQTVILLSLKNDHL